MENMTQTMLHIGAMAPPRTRTEPVAKPAFRPKFRRHRYTRHEEWANSAIHAVGALLGVIGLALLIAQAQTNGRDGSLVAVIVYGITLVLLFVCSALQHGLRSGPAKRLFLVLDHAGIFLVIAGTYTTFCLVLEPLQRNMLLAAIWTLAAIGIALEVRAFLSGRGKHYEKTAYLGYLLLGWFPILVSGGAMFRSIELAGTWLMVAGGLAYSIGIVFYLWTKLRFGHAVWHLFVLAASALHFLAVLLYVVPNPF
jgi:hemolysin III